ncbi:MFS transporter [Microbulbifer sp. S227A]|uniref:MFS transporter n=1 Tax=Microbulbifer sp. S227A TaxID=3415131 RepID=UPI003C7D9732
MELTLVPLLLHAIQLQFSLSVGDLAWVFNTYGIAVAAGVLLGGWCGDAFNTGKIFGYGIILFAAGSLLVAAAESFETLIIGRALQGLGGGVFSPLIPLLLTRASPQKPGRVLIVWGSIAGYIAALAPLFYGSFLSAHGWNLAFILIAVIAVFALINLNRRQGLEETPTYSGPKKAYSKLFQSKNLWMTFVYVFCTYGSITYYLFQLPVWLSNSEIKTASLGLLLTIMWLTFSGLSALLRNMVDGAHIRTIMLAAPLLIAVGLSLVYFDENLFVLAVSSVLVGSGLACSNAPSTQMILKFAPQGMSGLSTSLDITFARLGGIATVAILAESPFAFASPTICFLCLIAALCISNASKIGVT